METDPDIVAAQKKAGYDLDVLRHQLATAQVRENVLTSWYAEWTATRSSRSRARCCGRSSRRKRWPTRRRRPRPQEERMSATGNPHPPLRGTLSRARRGLG